MCQWFGTYEAWGFSKINITVGWYKPSNELLSSIKAPWWCLRLVVAVGLVCPNDLKSYAGGSIATGRVSQAGQVKSEVPD
jgi:hypothetical protein